VQERRRPPCLSGIIGKELAAAGAWCTFGSGGTLYTVSAGLGADGVGGAAGGVGDKNEAAPCFSSPAAVGMAGSAAGVAADGTAATVGITGSAGAVTAADVGAADETGSRAEAAAGGCITGSMAGGAGIDGGDFSSGDSGGLKASTAARGRRSSSSITLAFVTGEESVSWPAKYHY
jgi:hypothetical protein